MTLVTTERKKCRKCNRGKLDSRVKRSAFIKTLLFWLPIKRYRCDACYKKSYVIGPVFKNVKQGDLQLL